MQPAIGGKTPAAFQSRPLPIPAITRDVGDPGDLSPFPKPAPGGIISV